MKNFLLNIVFITLIGSSVNGLNPNPKQCSAAFNTSCQLKLEIECKILDSVHKGESCLNPDPDNGGFFISVPHGSEEEFNVEISYTVCNEGNVNFYFDEEKTNIMLKGVSLKPFMSSNILNGKPLIPRECRTKTARRKFSALEPNVSTSISVAGLSNNKWCGCYLFKRATFGIQACDVNKFRISQIALPKDQPDAKFIQLKNQDCANGVITDDLYIGVIHENNSEVTHHVHLKDLKVNEDGLLVICDNEDAVEATWIGNICSFNNPGTLLSGKGKDTYRLFTDASDSEGTTVDQYGVASPIKDLNDRKAQEIKKGKGVALRITQGIGRVWVPSEWTIIPNANAICRIGELCVINPSEAKY